MPADERKDARRVDDEVEQPEALWVDVEMTILNGTQ